jgi:hypothetical protein
MLVAVRPRAGSATAQALSMYKVSTRSTLIVDFTRSDSLCLVGRQALRKGSSHDYRSPLAMMASFGLLIPLQTSRFAGLASANLKLSKHSTAQHSTRQIKTGRLGLKH